jgi:hypothetical protein
MAGLRKKEKKLDCIRDFIEAWKGWGIRGIDYDQLDPKISSFYPWATRFDQAGYYSIELCLKSDSNLAEILEWCNTNIGESHFAYVFIEQYGEKVKFWFETEQNSLLFMLRWA